MDWKLELIAVPVTDVDRAKAFYVEQVGFNADHDHRVSDEMRFVQLTPPGSACSIAHRQRHHRTCEPGSVQGLQLVVDDVEAARARAGRRGASRSARSRSSRGAASCSSQDPDGNGWAIQQIVRTAGRVTESDR